MSERSRQKIVEAMVEWNELFDEPPSAVDWNATTRRRFPWRVERYESTGRRWPAASGIQKIFGSWNTAIEAAGLKTRSRKGPKRHYHANPDTARAVRALKGLCENGHPMSGENLYVSPKGKRNCRTCNRISVQRYQKRKLERAVES